MDKENLYEEYIIYKRSVSYIAKKYRCSEHKVNYWMKIHNIPKRTISSAIYQKWNPKGDPFTVRKLKTDKDLFLLGLGLGLYWGEGTKADKNSVRLGNSNPFLIRQFIAFLKQVYFIDESKLMFGIQIFNDLNPKKVLKFWKNFLAVKKEQFQKPVVSSIRGPGTYLHKAQYGVLTVYFNNTKLRNILCSEIEKLSKL